MKVRYRRRSPLRTVLVTLLVLALLGGTAAAGWFWYDNNVDRSGWVQEEGRTLYKDFHGKYVSGWQKIDGQTYYFLPDSSMATHWQTIGGETYCFSSEGVLLTGWQEIDGSRYYFGPSGAMASGWLTLDGQRYYLADGVMVTGWMELGGNAYYFDDSGAMATGWLTIDAGHRYYLTEDGTPVTGYVVLEDGCYCFDEDGLMLTGWMGTDTDVTYFLPDGKQAFGWAEIEGKRYYFDETGSMVTGWFQEGEYSYYLQDDGSAAVGPLTIDGQLHYFSPKGIHVVLVNASNPVPSYYDMELVTVTGWHQVSSVCYDALVQMLADCNAAGISYNFNSAHRTVAEQTMILELRTEEYMDTGMTYEAARAKALQSVAYPGTSEHHLGLAVDLLGDAAIAWLTEHCWDYGFIVRYTAEKQAITGIINEPWHFRYVGTEVSLDMKDSGLCLEEYLGAVTVAESVSE